MDPREQTIYALSSGRPPTAIAIVRVSGPQAGRILATLVGVSPRPRVATRALLRDHDGVTIDQAIALWFPGPASATGEDVAEFHIHGGRAVLAALLAALAGFENTRVAEPGEFTRRAFENGKLDLTEAEAVDDLIHADTEQQRRRALRQLQGLLGGKARSWRRRIIEAEALIEAGIDFSDEGDVPAEVMAPALAKIAALLDEIEETLAVSARSERLREGLVVAIAGAPNVGKSSLMNALARREVAIVSPQAGTTRDVIEVNLDLDGYPVTLMDTAGIRESDDPVEQEGVRRARARASNADLVLWLTDPEHEAEAPPLQAGAAVWVVRNKIDLDREQGPVLAHDLPAANRSPDCGGTFVAGASNQPRFAISVARGEGLQRLVAGVVEFARGYFGVGDAAAISRQRHRDLLRKAAELLHRSISSAPLGEEIVAEELRMAANNLGRLLGRVDVEDVLDVIFQEFCVGK